MRRRGFRVGFATYRVSSQLFQIEFWFSLARSYRSTSFCEIGECFCESFLQAYWSWQGLSGGLESCKYFEYKTYRFLNGMWCCIGGPNLEFSPQTQNPKL